MVETIEHKGELKTIGLDFLIMNRGVDAFLTLYAGTL